MAITNIVKYTWPSAEAAFLTTSSPRQLATLVGDAIGSIANGTRPGSISTCQAEVGGAAASATFTLASAVNPNTATVGTVVFTCINSGSPTNVQFLSGANDTAAAKNLAAAINANPTTKLIVSATSALGVVTVTALEKSLLGNYVTFTGSTNITANHATLVGGTSLTFTNYAYT
jgi:hypothetical protein